jgi:hypothetical protein
MNNQQQEVWQTMNLYPSYSFSNKGRVYSYRSNPNKYLVGSRRPDGYIQIHIKNYNSKLKQPLLSRIIYELFGDEPELLPYREVDHKNHEDKSNNDINNLRIATRTQNCANKGKRRKQKTNLPSSQYIGVSWCKQVNRWQSVIHVKKRFT